MYSTKYKVAKNINEAVSLFSDFNEPKYLAGGMTLIPTLKQRLLKTDLLIDLKNCKLNFIHEKKNSISIGAMTTHYEIETSELINKYIPGLSFMASKIGDRQVRNMGTIGGSIANNDPSACYPAALLSLNAIISTNKRKIEASQFFVGMFETALDDEEIITEIDFPKIKFCAYEKFSNPASGYAIVGVFISKVDSKITIAVTGAGQDGVFRFKQAEENLKKEFSTINIDKIKISKDNLLNDIHASDDYRAHLIKALTKRVINKLINIESDSYETH